MTLLGYTVLPEDEGTRLDSFIMERTSADCECDPVSRSAAAGLCEGGHVFVGGAAAGKKTLLRAGDRVTVELPDPVPDSLEPEDIPLDVVYEDSDLIVINKPSGMVVHPSPGHARGTLCAALLFHCGDSLSGIGGVGRPGIVHRIDKDTSGLLVAAKNDMAHASLSAQIKEHSCRRTYSALLVGNPVDDSGTVDLPIGRSPSDRKKMAVVKGGREAVTHWRILRRYSGYCASECALETGRTHQIRVHMSHIGHPVLGDPLYGGDRNRFCAAHPKLADGQFLHAGKLEFTHPRTGERMAFTCPEPANMLEAERLLGSL